MRKTWGLICAAALLFAAACDSGAPDVATDQEATWDVIQSRILQPKCTEACHSAGTSIAAQSDLVLTADLAYDQLVGATPTNQSAREDGLLRVHPSAATDLYKSYFWVKVNAPEQARLYKDTPEYGSLMPLGAPVLSFGELSFIRQWLLAGAPEEGIVADPVVLQDTSLYRIGTYEPLPILAEDEGISMRLGPFEVAPNFEREFFYRSPYQITSDLLVDRTTMAMRPGSHHFILYTYDQNTPASEMPPAGVIRDLRAMNGALSNSVFRQMQYHVFYSGTQWPMLDYEFPPGVALHLGSGASFDLNSHYVNLTDDPMQGEVQINLEYADPASVQHVARVLNLNNLALSLPPRKVTTVSKTFSANERMHVFQLFSHAHKHMIEFRVELAGGTRDGEMVYLATDYEHPPILEIDPPLVVEPGQGLRLVATYNNWTDRTLGFGFLSEDEMMILFGYYYTDSGSERPPMVAAD